MKHYELTPDCAEGFCPVETTLRIMSGKWKGIILYRLVSGKKRFSELKRMMPAISYRSLTLQLRQLEEDGIIERLVFPEVPPRVEYSLSPLGLSMIPIIESMYDWGMAYHNNELAIIEAV